MVCESTNPKVPYFNAPIYLENKVSALCRSMKRADSFLDIDWQGRRDSRSHKSGLFYDQTTGGHTSYVVQNW